MIFLIAAILCFCLTLIFYVQSRNAETTSRWSTRVGKKNILILDEEEAVDAGPETPTASLPVHFFICLALGIIFAILYLFYRSPADVHGLQVSYEELAIRFMGLHVTSLFSESEMRRPINTMVIVSEAHDPYMAKLTRQLADWLDAKLFSVFETKTVRELVPTRDISKLTYDQFIQLIRKRPELKLLISLAGFSAAEEVQWKVGPRPYVGVFFDTAELNHAANLIRAGIVDLAVVSKSNFPEHALIPTDRTLKEIFDDHFILIEPANLQETANLYKQTISTKSDMK